MCCLGLPMKVRICSKHGVARKNRAKNAAKKNQPLTTFGFGGQRGVKSQTNARPKWHIWAPAPATYDQRQDCSPQEFRVGWGQGDWWGMGGGLVGDRWGIGGDGWGIGRRRTSSGWALTGPKIKRPGNLRMSAKPVRHLPVGLPQPPGPKRDPAKPALQVGMAHPTQRKTRQTANNPPTGHLTSRAQDLSTICPDIVFRVQVSGTGLCQLFIKIYLNGNLQTKS